ncbi:hypothetical protein [Streptomyces boncukensis]|uniref:MFS transporter n=1 Tax=Streptomyces boncukensis TaxID=2711219 RepID=A0A6G4WT45_9ACTN|nr:hypothetical protein [Streptomyces boncukensis]
MAAARVLQGIATGAATTTLSAAPIDLEPPRAPGRTGVVTSVAPWRGSRPALSAPGCWWSSAQPRPDPPGLRPAARRCSALLGLGVLTALAGIVADFVWLAAARTVVAGVGLGASVLAAVGTFARVARPHERSAVFASANISNCLGNSVPAVLGGIAVAAPGE